MSILINNEKIKQLEPYAFENYISELVEHCNKCFPYLNKTMGSEKLRQTLKQAIDKAKFSGFTQKGSLQFYIDMLIIFGWSFEDDPQYPWIITSLKKNQDLSQIEQTAILYFEVEQYLDHISGKNSEILFAATQKLEKLTIDNIKVKNESFIQDMLLILKTYYPEKYHCSGETSIIELIKYGIQKAKQTYGFEEANQTALIIVLMFLLGHQFDHDPFYGWATIEKLSNKYVNGTLLLNDKNQMAKKLESRAKIWMAAMLQNNKNQ